MKRQKALLWPRTIVSVRCDCHWLPFVSRGIGRHDIACPERPNPTIVYSVQPRKVIHKKSVSIEPSHLEEVGLSFFRL